MIACVTAGFSNEATDLDLLREAGQGGAVQTLLAKGASVRVVDAAGRTPLHLASRNGHQATAELLLAAGAAINATDSHGQTPLDLARQGGHSGLTAFLLSKGGREGKPSSPEKATPESTRLGRVRSTPLKFETRAEFEREIGCGALLLEAANIRLFAPDRRKKEAQIVFGYLVGAYDSLRELTGVQTEYPIVVYVFPKGNTNAWGGTSACAIYYDESLLELERQPEWVRYRVPHVSGCIEEMAHNFVHATRAQFGWEMLGWSIGIEVARKVAGNPILEEQLRATKQEQLSTFERYVRGGFRFPNDLPANLCDRIHAWLLHRAAIQYGKQFWPDFFREVRLQRKALEEAVRAGNADVIRNERYRITVACFDRLPRLEFSRMLEASGISLTTDVKSLKPESAAWDRRL